MYPLIVSAADLTVCYLQTSGTAAKEMSSNADEKEDKKTQQGRGSRPRETITPS